MRSLWLNRLLFLFLTIVAEDKFLERSLDISFYAMLWTDIARTVITKDVCMFIANITSPINVGKVSHNKTSSPHFVRKKF